MVPYMVSIYWCATFHFCPKCCLSNLDGTQTWEPRPSDIVSFQCTEELTGRIFLIPTGTRLFILDFVDQEKHRVLNTGLHVYTTGFFGEAYRDRLFNYSHDPYTPLQSPLPIFILNPAGTIEITPQELPDNVMKTIVFPCSRGVYRPVVL